MPCIQTNHGQITKSIIERTTTTRESELITLDHSQEGPVIHGDKVMILLREFYVRDNLKDPIISRDTSTITLTGQIKTGFQKIDIPVGSFDGVRDKFKVAINEAVILPLTEIEDFLYITINAIKDDDLAKANDKIQRSLTFVNNVIQIIPGVAPVASPVVTLGADLINLIIALSPEQALIRESMTFMVSGPRYEDVKNVERIKTGLLYICEDGYKLHEDGKYYRNGEVGDPTRIILELIKPK